MRKLLFSFFVLLLPFTLVSAVAESQLSRETKTVLKGGTPYKITLSGTYVITTEKQRISSRIYIPNNLTVTLILEDCKIAPDNSLVGGSNIHYGAPIVIGGDNCSLTLQFRGDNELGCASNFSTTCFASAITLLPKTSNRTISVVIEEATDAPAGSSLSLYGRNVGNTVAYGPIYLPTSYTLNKTTYSVDASVTLQSGKIHLYTTDLLGEPYLSPAITATKVSLTG
ncbi:MAG: hypothetical protein Q4F99_06815, partial [bacterium]|nr:hypothetical protein [bacterium]